MRKNKILQEVKAGRPAFGPHSWTGSPSIIEVMGQFPFHFVNIDVEHTPYSSYELVEHLCRAAELAGLTPISSIATPDPLQITKLLEIGVMGFIVGHTITGEDAQQIVDAAMYPPKGRRGTAATIRQLDYALGPPNMPELEDKMNKEVVLIPKIEDEEALHNLDDILSTGIHGLFVGSGDLSHSIARNLDIPDARANVAHPKVLEARNKIIEKCGRVGKFSGAVLGQLQAEGKKTPAQVLEEWVPQGVLTYTLGTEFSILGSGYRNMCQELGLTK